MRTQIGYGIVESMVLPGYHRYGEAIPPVLQAGMTPSPKKVP